MLTINVTEIELDHVNGNDHPPGAYRSTDGKLFFVYGGMAEPRMVMQISSQYSEQLLTRGLELQAAATPVIDVHRLLDQIIDVMGSRIETEHITGRAG